MEIIKMGKEIAAHSHLRIDELTKLIEEIVNGQEEDKDNEEFE